MNRLTCVCQPLANRPLEDALQLVKLYAGRGSRMYGKAGMRWLERYLTEHSPRLSAFAKVTANLANTWIESLGSSPEIPSLSVWPAAPELASLGPFLTVRTASRACSRRDPRCS
jgi:hypothetical protein